jgi:S-formylglutathione hydrolase FrmB
MDIYKYTAMNDNTPVMYWLSGLTCDDTNFAMKAGSKAFDAAEKQVCDE